MVPAEPPALGRGWWVSAAAAAGVAAAAGAAVYFATRALRADHARTVRVRSARARFRELMRELSRCKGAVSHFDSEAPSDAQEVDTAVRALASSVGDDAAALDRATQLSNAYQLANEELTRLMQMVDGVEPAQVLVAAGLEPWSEFEAKPRKDAERGGFGAVLDMAKYAREVRRNLILGLTQRGAVLESRAKKLGAAIVTHTSQADKHPEPGSAAQAL
ncbi:hypothetical protein H4R19_005089 [Coemansia spiralis]|nr:hypothetical protein H4R19_005089 [Coemansia spiralis]